MYKLFRPLLFRLDPETAHGLTLTLVRLAGILPPVRWLLQAVYAAPEKPVEAFGLKFRNPVGLAAGYDKDGIAIRGLAALGFGHLEIGTVTPLPQPGNPRPRLFRLEEEQGIINRMGFPGKGMEAVAMLLQGALKGRRGNLQMGEESALPPGLDTAKNMSTRPTAAPNDIECHFRLKSAARCGFTRNDIVIGVNLGKNKVTPLENAAGDYLTLMRRFMPLADYLAINVSSPNTVGLRRLQGREMLAGLLGAIAEERGTVNVKLPILVKIAPDLNDEELDDALDVILHTGMDGVIATNTTLEREGLKSAKASEQGGLSGRPLTTRSEAMLEKVVKRLNGRLPVISVGGIMSSDDAKRRLGMGAALVQVYTGLVYAGPGLVKRIIQKT